MANNPFTFLKETQKTWLVTGAAGFIGSHIVEELLSFDQKVVGLDNFLTGRQENLDLVKGSVTSNQWGNFKFIRGDICDPKTCHFVMKNVDFVIHQAALTSVPLSIEKPDLAHDINVNGFLNVLKAAKENKIKKVVYASSSAVYGNRPGNPKTEDQAGSLESPYAATKWINESYAQVWSKIYGLPTTGLRYFNIYGPRQDPTGGYAAVIPLWIKAGLRSEPLYVNGDGTITRDFCFVKDVVKANISAALSNHPDLNGISLNIGSGHSLSLNDLSRLIQSACQLALGHKTQSPIIYREPRPGDILHSQADIGSAKKLIGFQPTFSFEDGLSMTIKSFIEKPLP